MDTQRTTQKDIKIFHEYLLFFKNILRFDNNNGYFFDSNKKLWIIQKRKYIYMFVRNITEKFFPNYKFTDSEIINWTDLIKKSLPEIKLNSHLILTNDKLYNTKTKTYIEYQKITKKDYVYIYTPLNIKHKKK